MQYVKLDLGGRAYTYMWDDCDGEDRLAPDDVVWIPGNAVNPHDSRARVIRVLEAPDYDGPITEILFRDLI